MSLSLAVDKLVTLAEPGWRFIDGSVYLNRSLNEGASFVRINNMVLSIEWDNENAARIRMPFSIRNLLEAGVGKTVSIEFCPSVPTIKTLQLIRLPSKIQDVPVAAYLIKQTFLNCYCHQSVNRGQTIILTPQSNVRVSVQVMDFDSATDCSYGLVDVSTSVVIVDDTEDEVVAAINDPQTVQHAMRIVDLTDTIGGFASEIGILFDRAILPHLHSQQVRAALNVRTIKGVILHGPPGTGKTHIMCNLARLLPNVKVIIRSTSEFRQKYVGEGERIMREMFQPAYDSWSKLGSASPLYIFVLDEIDAIMRHRSDTANASGDSVVNLMLSSMDGVNSCPNILVIGTTNRPDLLDPALMRSGRFELSLKIGLPTEQDRLAILEVHVKDIRRYLRNVDLAAIAHLTPNFTAAELRALCEGVKRLILKRITTIEGQTYKMDSTLLENMVVTHDDFVAVIDETPTLNTTSKELATPKPFIQWCDHLDHALQATFTKMDALFKSNRNRTLIVYLEGAKGSGCSAIANFICCKYGHLPFTNQLSPQTMTVDNKISKITEFFQRSFLVDQSIVVLDHLERMLEWSISGAVNSRVLNTLLTFIMPQDLKKTQQRVIICISHTSRATQDFESEAGAVIKVPLITEWSQVKTIVDGLNLEQPCKDSIKYELEKGLTFDQLLDMCNSI